MNRIIYGPVPSRRLGISLGVDIVPYKTCSYDCVYCQLGKTAVHAVQRKSFVPVDPVIKEIKGVVDQNNDIDYITFSGSGEPTLNSDIGGIIRRIKEFTQIPVAVLTNGSLLWQPEVRTELSPADLVVPSVDAVSEEIFQRINRPVKGLKLSRILHGIAEFCKSFNGRVYVEILLVRGLNDSNEEIKKISQFVRKLNADRIQLNTVVRPPSDPTARPVDEERLLKIKALFDPALPVEIAADFDKMAGRTRHEDLEQAITGLLRRRPARLGEMAKALGVHPNQIAKHLRVLEEEKKIRRSEIEKRSEEYYLFEQK